jgi:hypothetical protein
VGEFRYSAAGAGTRLEWTYAFLPTSGLLRLVVRRFLTWVMTPMMTATRTGVEVS